MGLAQVAVLGVLLALQIAGVQYYYQQKYAGLDPAKCEFLGRSPLLLLCP